MTQWKEYKKATILDRKWHFVWQIVNQKIEVNDLQNANLSLDLLLGAGGTVLSFTYFRLRL